MRLQYKREMWNHWEQEEALRVWGQLYVSLWETQKDSLSLRSILKKIFISLCKRVSEDSCSC